MKLSSMEIILSCMSNMWMSRHGNYQVLEILSNPIFGEILDIFETLTRNLHNAQSLSLPSYKCKQ
jgi:hypothetical protein